MLADNASTAARGRPARKTPFLRTVSGLARDPLGVLDAAAARAGGDVIRVNLGLSRPYLLTRPEHVQHVLRDHCANYAREGMLWQPVRRVLGNGILGEGPRWRFSRKLMQPLFTHQNVASLVDLMVDASEAAMSDLATHAGSGARVDALAEMTRVVYKVVGRALFGDRIALDDAERLVGAIATAATSVGPRLVLPFVPDALPMPGDRAFRRAVRTVDDVVFPLVRAARASEVEGRDVVSVLARARDEHGDGLSDRDLRDDIFSMFAAGTETTALALTWFWTLVEAHPEVAEQLYAEIDAVVGAGPVRASHLRELTYTSMVMNEVLRVRPLIWFLPRTAKAADVIDGVRIPAGATVVVSPYLTHRLPDIWDRPDVFDPQRFAPDRAGSRHRFAHIPFGAGQHQCIGNHFFMIETQIIVATIASRFRPAVVRPGAVRPQPAVTLRPRERVELTVAPAPRPGASARQAA